MNSLRKNNIQWDKIFDFATEDISIYLWALESWIAPPDEYEKDYLLLQILNSRARSRFAISLIKEAIQSEYHLYRDKLNKMWIAGENFFSNFIEEHHKEIESIITNKFNERLSQLEQDIKKIIRIAKDGDLINDPEWIQEDLKENAHNFLQQFQKMANSHEEIQSEVFLKYINSEKFTHKFMKIDTLFKKNFGYFNPVDYLLIAFREREYTKDQWWLTRHPEPNDIEKEKFPDKILESLMSAFQKLKSDIDCPQSENAIAYAFNELPIDKIKPFKNHMLECRFCFDLVLDCRIAEIESKERGDKLLKEPEFIPVKKAISNIFIFPDLSTSDDYSHSLAAANSNEILYHPKKTFSFEIAEGNATYTFPENDIKGWLKIENLQANKSRTLQIINDEKTIIFKEEDIKVKDDRMIFLGQLTITISKNFVIQLD